MSNKEYLEATALGAASHWVLLKLKHNIQKSLKEEMNGKKQRPKFENPLIDEICEILFEYIPEGYFWENEVEGILKDMQRFGFDEQCSITRNVKKPSAIIKRLSAEKITCYEEISLLEHTYNIIQVCKKQLQNNRYIRARNFDVLMSVLLHDFGKSFKLQIQTLNYLPLVTENTHEESSGNYISQRIVEIVKELEGKGMNGILTANEIYAFQNIKKAVVSHHEHSKEETEDLSFYVREADYLARVNEWVKYLEIHPEVTENKLIKDIR